MSDNNTNRETESTGLVNFTRRRALQAMGAGITSASLLGSQGVVAESEAGCARGPFEATYEPGVVNVGQIRAEQAKGKEVPVVNPGSPGTGGPMDAQGHTPPNQNAQESMADEDGPLTIRTEFEGVNSLETRGGVPSDSQVAAGNGHLVHALNRNIAIYNKQSGKREQLFLLERLWEPVIPEPEPGGFAFGIPFVFDPRARYDRNHDRYILAATQFEPGLRVEVPEDEDDIIGRESVESGEYPEEYATVFRPPRGWFLVAVSATSNPNGKWYVYRIPPEDARGLDNIGLVDYPTLGFDKDAIYLTQNFFGAHFEVTMVTLDKDEMYAGEQVTAHHFDQMSDPNADGATFTVHPAQQPFSGGSDGTFYMVNSDFPVPFPGPTGTLTLWEVTDPVSNPSVSCSTIDVDPYFYPPAARQPDTDSSFIDTLGTRVMNADYNDGSLWTAHSTAVDWNGDGTPVAAIRWYEIDVTTGSVVQSGTYGEPDTSYFMPTIGSEGDSTVIVHNVSGPETYVRMDVAGRTEDHSEGKLEDSVVVEEGKSKYVALPNEVYGPVERWGDYNGFSIDPASGRFWTVSQYSPDIDIPESDPQRDPYFTRIAEVYFEDEQVTEDGGGPPN